MVTTLPTQPVTSTPHIKLHNEMHRDNLSTANINQRPPPLRTSNRNYITTVNTTRDQSLHLTSPHTLQGATERQLFHCQNHQRTPHTSHLTPHTSHLITGRNAEKTSQMQTQLETPTPSNMHHTSLELDRGDVSTVNTTRNSPPTSPKELQEANISTAYKMRPPLFTPHKELHKKDIPIANTTRDPPTYHTSRGATQRQPPHCQHNHKTTTAFFTLCMELHINDIPTANTTRD